MDHDWRVTTPDVQPTGRSNARLRQTAWDMVRSMAVVLVVVFVIVLLAWRPEPEAVKVVATAPTVSLAAREAQFPMVAPSGLAEQWRATSVRWEPTEESRSEPVLHIGYVTPSDEYAQVAVAPVASEAFLDEQTADGAPAGTQAVGDVTWQRWESDRRRSLVLVDGEGSVVVSGSAEWAELIALAESLEPVASGSEPAAGGTLVRWIRRTTARRPRRGPPAGGRT
jgi:hypothetical protein